METPLFAVDEPVSGSIGKTSFPDFPGEKPSKLALERWCDAWYEDLCGMGYSAVLRGEEPFELKKLAPRDLLPVPAEPAAAASVAAKNSEIEHSNAVNEAERVARLREIKNRIAQKLKRALRTNAGLKLKKLLTDHAVHEPGTTNVIEDCYDGVAMFKAIRDTRSDDMSDYDAKKYTNAYEKMRDTPLPENCSPETFSKRVATFLRDVNPYLDPPLTGSKLSAFIVKQLPSQLGADARSLKRRFVDQGTWNDADAVALECQHTVEEAFAPTKKAGVDINLAHLLTAEGYADSLVAAVDKGNGSSGGKELSEARVRQLISGAIAGSLRSGVASGTGDDKGGDKAAGGKPGSKQRKGNRLPEGQLCSSGTCNFDHDRLKPGAPTPQK